MGILVMLVLLVTQVVNSASTIINVSERHLDADSQARGVFERMELDFNGMLRYPDVDCSIYPYNQQFRSGGNESLFFWAEGNAILASAATNALSVYDTVGTVGYRIDSNTPSAASINAGFLPYSLERWAAESDPRIGGGGGAVRLATAMTGEAPWAISYVDNPSNVEPLSTLMGSNPQATATGVSTKFHTLGEGVFRLEFSFLMKDSAYTTRGNNVYAGQPYWKMVAAPNGGHETVVDPTELAQQIQDMRNVAAIVVTIAILDTTSRTRMPGYSRTSPTGSYLRDMYQLVEALQDEDTPKVANDWNNIIANLGTNRQGLSAVGARVAASNARVYQRFFYLK
jgi:hypothetical protein